MIAAFGKIAAKQASGVNPASLASDISFALITTAVGLMIAIPLVMCMASMQVRIGRLTDNVQHQIGQFLDQLEHALAKRKSS
jgi:biopolymer transport protein ExbB/TolQ